MTAARPAVAALAMLVMGLAPAPAPAQEAPKPDEATLVLFDGTSLDGWKSTDFFEAPAAVVADGAIRLPKGKPMSGVTSTRTDLPTNDYELTYEARRTEGGDFFAAATFPVGDSHATLVNGGWGGSVTGISSLDGADASENGSSTYVKYENGKWYTFRVRVAGGRIRAWVDDKKVVDEDVRDRKVSTRIEVRSSRPLGFATWYAVGEIRKVEVKKLPPEPVPPPDDK